MWPTKAYSTKIFFCLSVHINVFFFLEPKGRRTSWVGTFLNTFASSEGHLSTPTPIEILELLKIEVLRWSEHVRINSTACIFNGVIRASACVWEVNQHINRVADSRLTSYLKIIISTKYLENQNLGRRFLSLTTDLTLCQFSRESV